eukprot:gb/GECG01015813.1/.p1 GENE.gb/GECG01015813.1/~~gb/GECG01015813.1/.p1  ORF type:complete len:794 (+),score=96.57 gb/GECG01015813.1/:1-2382(+)
MGEFQRQITRKSFSAEGLVHPSNGFHLEEARKPSRSEEPRSVHAERASVENTTRRDRVAKTQLERHSVDGQCRGSKEDQAPTVHEGSDSENETWSSISDESTSDSEHPEREIAPTTTTAAAVESTAHVPSQKSSQPPFASSAASSTYESSVSASSVQSAEPTSPERSSRRSASESMVGKAATYKPSKHLQYFRPQTKSVKRGSKNIVSPLMNTDFRGARTDSFAVTKSPLYRDDSEDAGDSMAQTSIDSHQDTRNRRQKIFDSIKRAVRKKVSKKKRRFQEGEFDLDLTYITPRLIAMGYPAKGAAAAYRNPIHEVQRFFETRHPRKYMIYNLCTERSYPKSEFNYCVQRYPFDDHNAPPLEMLLKFCQSVRKWLSQDSYNVAAVHCKAGKGRTGMMIAAYLLFSGECNSAREALAYFGSYRTLNDSGVTIPSQKRYVYYFERMLQTIQDASLPKQMPVKRPTFRIKHIRIESVPNIDSHGCIPIFDLYVENQRVFEYKKGLTALQQASEANVSTTPAFNMCTDATMQFKKFNRGIQSKVDEIIEDVHEGLRDGGNLTFLYSQQGGSTSFGQHSTFRATHGIGGLGLSGLCGVGSSKAIRQYIQMQKGEDIWENTQGLSGNSLEGKPRRFLVHEPFMDIDCSCFDLRIAGNVKLSLKHDRLPAPTKLCHVWFHTAYVESPALVFTRQVVDKACKDTKGIFPSNFSIELYLERVDAPPLPPLKLTEQWMSSTQHTEEAQVSTDGYGRTGSGGNEKQQETEALSWGHIQDSITDEVSARASSTASAFSERITASR